MGQTINNSDKPLLRNFDIASPALTEFIKYRAALFLKNPSEVTRHKNYLSDHGMIKIVSTLGKLNLLAVYKQDLEQGVKEVTVTRPFTAKFFELKFPFEVSAEGTLIGCIHGSMSCVCKGEEILSTSIIDLQFAQPESEQGPSVSDEQVIRRIKKTLDA